MSRSGRISDLNDLVHEATGARRRGDDSVASSHASSRRTSTDAASLSSFSQSIARVARAAETKEAASIRSITSRSVSSRSSFLPAMSSNSTIRSHRTAGSVDSRRSSNSDSERTDTTARLMSLVQELSHGSNSTEIEEERRRNDELEKEVQMLRDTLQHSNDKSGGYFVNNEGKDDRGYDSRSVDEESLSLASGLQNSVSHSRQQGLEPGGAAPDSTALVSSGLQPSPQPTAQPVLIPTPQPFPQPGPQPSPQSVQQPTLQPQSQPMIQPASQNSLRAVPYTRIGEDPSVASGSAASFSHYGSYSSNQYTNPSNASSGTGSEDPAGYVMPLGLGVLPDGTVFSQHTSSVYNGSYLNSSHDPSVASRSASHAPSRVSRSTTNASQSVISGSQSTISGSQSTISGSQSTISGSHSMGSGSHSMGSGSYSTGSGSHSMGSGSYSTGSGGHSMGSGSYSTGSGGQSGMSRSFVSHLPPSHTSTSPSQPASHYQPLVPRYADEFTEAGGHSFESGRSRSIAESAALVPRAKFSWASESVGTQSTVLTRRSLASASVPEPNEQRVSKEVEGRLWASFAYMITFPIPNKCVMRPTKDAKQAWREKVALFLTMVSCSVFFVGVFGFVPLLLCKEDTVFSMQDIWLQTGENWVVVHGAIYDVKDLIYRHPGGVDGIVDFLGKDASKVFPRAPPVTLPQKCLDMEKVEAYQMNVYAPDNNFTNPTCDSFSELDILLGITCHTFAAGSNGTAKFLGDYDRGVLSHTTSGLNTGGARWIAIYDRVYDVTTYVNGVNSNQKPVEGGEETTLFTNPSAYLTPTLNKVIMNSLNSDATDLYEALFGSDEYIACLEEMFYIGLLDDEFDTFCYTLNILMYVMLIFVATLMVIQFLASMVYICPRHRTYTEEDVMSPVMVMVPCYNEGDNELRKTIKSVLNTTYPDENKVLFMVADGIVTGNGEDMSTPEHLANILGFDIDEFHDDTFEYDCIGVLHTKNRARVYHGILQKGHKFLKYISVVKCGLPEEATTSAKPGNRGKRDSQLVTIGYYNRIHYGRELTELDSAIQRAMVDLNLQADMVRFLMAIDADTRVDTMSITHMVYGMDKKERVLALCGETKVDNKASSWVTMIQVFEYYNSHHLKKAFEAAFGCVTCLPGCFTMYRIIADDGTPLLPGDGVLFEYSRNDVETLHEKNLYHLGEDRMLTTLLLKYYPDRSLTFIPEAACWTIVPHTFKILLSQRRRWINSTIHNMFELLRVNTMCGVCCCSMKVVVAIDLIATMILPASYCYAMYLIFLVFFEDLPVSTILLILYAIIMGVQVVVFILRSRWDYMWWFLIYFTAGLPVFYLVLPTYSFWNMDDFSWGKTRAVGGSAAANAEDDSTDDDGAVKTLKDPDNENSQENDDRSATSSSTGSSTGSDSASQEESEYSEEEDDFLSQDGSYYSGSQRSNYSNSRRGSQYSDGNSRRGSQYSDSNSRRGSQYSDSNSSSHSSSNSSSQYSSIQRESQYSGSRGGRGGSLRSNPKY